MKILPTRIPGAPGSGILDQLGALGHPRHAQPRLGEAAALRIIGFERRARLGWTTPARRAAAIASTVMSSWVGPMPPVVNR
jgi:hypothetical protein